MARILFVHNNFPAQFGRIAARLAGSGHHCAAIASTTGKSVAGIPLATWRLGRGTTPGLFAPAVRAEADLLRGTAAAECAVALRERGFSPDLIIGHPGWGETLFLRAVFPAARQILYGEFYYRASGGDVGFDPEFGRPSLAETMRVEAKNATGLLAYAEADRIVSPTAFQAATFPPLLRGRQRVIHEGIDTDRVRPAPPTPVALSDGTVLGREAEPVVTFVNRRFEPMRGFHTFMRALPRLFAEVPSARAVLVGNDAPGGYGGSAGDGTTWKARMLAELGGRLDLSRVHFTGVLPHAEMHALMRLGAAHVYLTYPFALSWSMLEAMALGCLVIGSRTPPVEEVLTDRENGLLVDMLDPQALAAAMVEACLSGRALAPLRLAARRTVVDRYDLRTVCEPAWMALVAAVMATGEVERSERPDAPR